jgi:hypothetical protein
MSTVCETTVQRSYIHCISRVKRREDGQGQAASTAGHNSVLTKESLWQIASGCAT